eukprot:1470005-Amphidinium_carterae.1
MQHYQLNVSKCSTRLSTAAVTSHGELLAPAMQTSRSAWLAYRCVPEAGPIACDQHHLFALLH